MLEDFFDDIGIFDKCDNFHRAAAFGTDERIDLVNFLDETDPILPELYRTQLRHLEARDLIIHFAIWIGFWIRFSMGLHVEKKTKIVIFQAKNMKKAYE